MTTKSNTDTSGLEDFLISEVDRLYSGVEAGDAVMEKKRKFVPTTFFETVDQFYRDKNQKLNIDKTATLLDRYVPQLFKALENDSQDFVQARLYQHWIVYLAKNALDRSRWINTTTRYGGELIGAATSMSHPQIAYNLLVFSSGQIQTYYGLKTKQDIPQDDKDKVSAMLLEHAPKALQNFATLGNEGLGDIETIDDYKDMQDGERHGYYYSYCTNARLLYSSCINLLQVTTTPENVEAFIEETYPQLCENILQRKNGYRVEKPGSEPYDVTWPDLESANKCFEYGLLHFVGAAKDAEGDMRTGRYVFDHGPELLNALLEKEDGNVYNEALEWHSKTFEAIQKGLKGLSYERSFSVLAGGRAAHSLLEKGHCHEAASILTRTKSVLENHESDMLVLCDPYSDTPTKPLAAVFQTQSRVTEPVTRGMVVLIMDNGKDMSLKPGFKPIPNRFDKENHLADIVYHNYSLQTSFREANGQIEVSKFDQEEITQQAFTIALNLQRANWQEMAFPLQSRYSRLYSCPVRPFVTE